MSEQRYRVLLVEDNLADARLIRETLSDAMGARFELESAGRLATGLSRLGANDIDVVLLDLGLPDSQGRDTFARVQSQAPHVPIIVLTGMEDEDLSVALVQEGAQDYLLKSQVNGSLLARAICHAIERKRGEQQIRRLNEQLEQRVEERTAELTKANQSLQAEIAERKRAEEELERFFTLSLDLFCIAGFDRCFKRLNPAWEKTLGFTSEELLARSYLEFVHPDDRERTNAEAQKLTTGVQTISFENRYLCKDGSYKWLLWNANPWPERQSVYASARDITERKRAEEEITKLNQDLERRASELTAINAELEAFTYSIAHDLRAPLRHIIGFSRILVEEHGPRLEPEARQNLDRIHEAARHMGNLVDDLLNLSRVGRSELHRQLTGLNSLVTDALAELKTETESREIEWKIGRLPFVDCDPGLMKQVFTNLLSNALKYTRPRERALIEVDQTTVDGQAVLFVRDNGVGFDMKYADKLFGVFQRLHRPEDFEGTGVGLAIVQRIIRKHGGRIWAQAELNKGASFCFTVGSPQGEPQKPGEPQDEKRSLMPTSADP